MYISLDHLNVQFSEEEALTHLTLAPPSSGVVAGCRYPTLAAPSSKFDIGCGWAVALSGWTLFTVQQPRLAQTRYVRTDGDWLYLLMEIAFIRI